MAYRREDVGLGTDLQEIQSQRGHGEPPLFHKQLVGKRLYINAQVRFLVTVGIVLGALGGKYVLGVEHLDIPGLVLLAALLAGFNVGVFVFARRRRNLERRLPAHRLVMGLTHVTIGVDFVFLTVALWLVGGAKSPFQAFYLLHVVLAAILLSSRAAYAHAAFGYALFALLVLGEWAGFLPMRFPVGVVNSDVPLDGRFVITVLVVQAMLMALAVYLVTGLTDLLRRGEQQLRVTNAELERLSQIQRDFLHIALHDLKSPINAATMLLQSMKIAAEPPLSPQQSGWLDRIHVRLSDASSFLHDFSVLAALDAADMARQAEILDIGPLVETAVEENQDMICAHGHTLEVEVVDNLPPTRSIKRLVHEAINNLITNADKYTPANGRIAVRVRQNGDMVRVEVEDNGIGIAPDDQKRLFQAFVRIKRKDGMAADVSGSGLGLSIVRRVAELHGGNVGVSSALNKGSTFFLELPIYSGRSAAQDTSL